MEIKELQYFIAVADAGSLSAAAEKLFISHQGISSAVLRLETELGYPLLSRGPGGVALTERGRALYESAMPVVSSFQELQRAFLNPDCKPAISISCSFSIIPKCPRSLQRLLLNQNPDYAVEVSEHFYLESETLVENGACSFAILYGPIDENRFRSYPLFQRNYCIVVNNSHPLAKQETLSIHQLKDEELIIPYHKSRSNMIIRELCHAAGFEPHVALECDRPLEVIQLVHKNPELVARMFEEDVKTLSDPGIKMLRFSDINSTIPICLIEKKRRTFTKLERGVRSAILSCVRNDEKK